MPDITTIARPYAKAVFEHALDVNQLSQWSEVLNILAMSVMNSEVKQFISNPATTQEEQADLLMAPFAKWQEQEKQSIRNLVSLLASNKRLLALPEIKALFEELRAEQEKTLVVKVRSFSKLSPSQEEKLKESLRQRLRREVTLQVSVDDSLLGGAVIQAGDLVIDGSVRGKITKLRTELAA